MASGINPTSLAELCVRHHWLRTDSEVVLTLRAALASSLTMQEAKHQSKQPVLFDGTRPGYYDS